MSMRALYALIMLLTAHQLIGQVESANELFDNFEFKAAAELYSEANQLGSLNEEDQAKLAFCYIAQNEYVNAESILNQNPRSDPYVEAMFIETLKALGKIELARKTYVSFCERDSSVPDQVWLASLDSIESWKHYVSRFDVYEIKSLNSNVAELSPQIHKNGLLYLSEQIEHDVNIGGPAIAYSNTKGPATLQYGISPTPRTAIVYAEFEEGDTLLFKPNKELFSIAEQHLGPFCLDQDRKLIYFTQAGLPELDQVPEIPWIYFGEYEILPKEVSHIKPIGSKVPMPLFETIILLEEDAIRDEVKKLEDNADQNERLIAQLELYLQVINMDDMQIIIVVDSLFEAGELSSSLANAINEHIESKGTPNEEAENETYVFWQPKAGNFATGTPALSQDGKTMIFSSTMPGGYGGSDLYMIELEDGRWLEPKNLGPHVNTSGNEMFPFLKNESTLYFSSDGWPGYGALDLFVSMRINNKWSTTTNMLRPFNSPGNDHGIVFELAGLAGYFVSDRSGGTGDDDIYRFSERVAYRGAEVSEEEADDLYKKFVAIGDALFEDRDLLDSREAYEEAHAIRGEEPYPPEMIKVIDGMLINMITADNPVVFTNIYYDYNRYNITPEASKELERLTLFLLDNPGVKVKMSSYADARGGHEFNIVLSEKRAAAAKRFLVTYGVEEDRVITYGEGATKFVTVCPVPADCTEEEHALNRRTEFNIIR